RVTPSLAGSSSRSTDGRLVSIRRAISALDRPSSAIASWICLTKATLITRPTDCPSFTPASRSRAFKVASGGGDVLRRRTRALALEGFIPAHPCAPFLVQVGCIFYGADVNSFYGSARTEFTAPTAPRLARLRFGRVAHSGFKWHATPQLHSKTPK